MAQTQTSVAGTFLDPDSIPETLCNGPFNVIPGPVSIITFTQSRPQVNELFNNNNVANMENIVRARIAFTL